VFLSSLAAVATTGQTLRPGPSRAHRVGKKKETAPHAWTEPPRVATGHWLGPCRRQVGPGLLSQRCARGNSCTRRPGPRLFLCHGGGGDAGPVGQWTRRSLVRSISRVPRITKRNRSRRQLCCAVRNEATPSREASARERRRGRAYRGPCPRDPRPPGQQIPSSHRSH
jgi:hypothetical protein